MAPFAGVQEATLEKAELLKKILDGEQTGDNGARSAGYWTDKYRTAVKELVTDANLDCSEEGIVSRSASRQESERCVIFAAKDPMAAAHCIQQQY